MIDDEAICVLSDDQGWLLTAAFRNGTPDSMLAVDVGNAEEFRRVPEHLRTACWPVDFPCVTFQSGDLVLIREPHQLRCLAAWLVRASMALEALP